MRSVNLAALVALALAPPAASASAGSPAGVGLGAAHPVACASGYHPDAGGNCQPNVAQVSRYCPPGSVFEPVFDGWRCDPAPPDAY